MSVSCCMIFSVHIIGNFVTHHVSNYVGVTSGCNFAKQPCQRPIRTNEKMKLLLLFVSFAALSAVATAVNGELPLPFKLT